MKEINLLVPVKIKTSADVELNELDISMVLLEMETTFNSTPTIYRVHLGEPTYADKK